MRPERVVGRYGRGASCATTPGAFLSLASGWGRRGTPFLGFSRGASGTSGAGFLTSSFQLKMGGLNGSAASCPQHSSVTV